MDEYVALLREELAATCGKLSEAEPEAVPVLVKWIGEIQRDIARYSVNQEDRHGKTRPNRREAEPSRP